MNNLENFIFEQAKSVIQKIDENDLSDIYAYSFYVCDVKDDPRMPSVIIGFNTKTNLNKNINSASSISEAKWNYAFWLQNFLSIIGEDEKSQALINDWLNYHNLNFSDSDYDNYDYETCLEKEQKITKSFVSILISLVQKLHNDQITELPILIHELEYYDEIRDQNILANGFDRVKEFVNWINNQ